MTEMVGGCAYAALGDFAPKILRNNNYNFVIFNNNCNQTRIILAQDSDLGDTDVVVFLKFVKVRVETWRGFT
ncbi:MAG: hypothetical protein JOZ57_13470 [Abitibacteriaceae bacterium]|nr:hypothetical protein [Abditibacteriaceae bacterium]